RSLPRWSPSTTSRFSTSLQSNNFCWRSSRTFTRKERTTQPTQSLSVTWYDPTAGKWRSSATRKIIRRQRLSLVSEVLMSRLKNFSRSGAATQRKFTRSVAALRRCVSIFLLLLLSYPALSQTKSARFAPDGTFWIIGEAPNGFSDFGGINLNQKKLRRLPASGVQTNEGTTYRFK